MQTEIAKVPYKNRIFPPSILFSIVFVLFFVPRPVKAGIILDAEIKLTYEDNVVGLLSDQQNRQAVSGGGVPGGMAMMAQGMGGMGGKGSNGRYTGAGSSTESPGDFSATLYAEAGGYQPVTSDTNIFAKGFAENQTYNTYTDLNSIIGGVSGGIATIFNSSVSGRAAIFGKVKRYNDSERDSTSYGVNLSLKENINPDVWLREFGEYEKNNADSSFFTYDGTTIGVGVGYSVTKQTLVSVGYRYLIENYDQPSGSDIKTNTVSLNAEYAFSRSWVLTGEYDFEESKVSSTGSNNTDNIFSIALRYSY